jgi:hypothetical protein
VTFSDVEEFVELAYESGWTDGLPVIPPDRRSVHAALETVSLDPGLVLWETCETALSVTDVAISATMAGCKSSYFPIVTAAVQAFLDALPTDPADIPTLVEASQCLVVNGPARISEDINCNFGLYGPGWRANATIGRAVQMIARVIVGGRPSAFGGPGQYSLCFGEDEENSPWTPLHVQRGYHADASTVTVFSTLVQSLCADRHSKTPEALLDNLVLYARGKMSGSAWFDDDPCSLLLVIPPETRRVLSGWTKESVHQYLYLRITAEDGTPIQPVRLASTDELSIVAAGGPAFAAIQLSLCHRVLSNTKEVVSGRVR